MIIRDIETVTCCICGREFDKIRTRQIFTGRVKYICAECEAMANKEIDGTKTSRKKTVKKEKSINKVEDLKK